MNLWMIDMVLIRLNKIAIQATAQMAADKEAIESLDGAANQNRDPCHSNTAARQMTKYDNGKESNHKVQTDNRQR